MKTTAKRSRYGKTAFEKSVDAAMERVIVAPTGMTISAAHEAAKAFGRVIRTEKRGAQIVSILA